MNLSVTSYTNWIVARWPDKRCLPLSGHYDVALFKWRCQWHWIDTKLDNDVIIVNLKSESTWNRQREYQVRVFWHQVYQARLRERMLNRSASLAMSTSVLEALPGKLDIKKHSPSILCTPGSMSPAYFFSRLFTYNVTTFRSNFIDNQLI